MPDGQSDGTRNFVVVYDTQPQGTGYLHRLAKPEEFRRRPGAGPAARSPAATAATRQGRCATAASCATPATSEFALMSRDEALGMLDRLLDSWDVEEGTRTDEISLIHQVESELELQFLTKLLALGETPGSGLRIDRRTDHDGARIADLRFVRDGGQSVTHWQMKLQNTVRGTRPDVHFKRLDAPSPEVAVYLDGFKYHASSQYNRLADDAEKRARLRAHGYLVFAATWDDVKTWGGTEGTGAVDTVRRCLQAGGPGERTGVPSRRGPGRARGDRLGQPGRAADALPRRSRPDALAAAGGSNPRRSAQTGPGATAPPTPPASRNGCAPRCAANHCPHPRRRATSWSAGARTTRTAR